MYKLKLDSKQFHNLLKMYGRTQKEIAEIIGVAKTYISQMANGREVSKLCAYSICKVINADFEIEDLFYYRTN